MFAIAQGKVRKVEILRPTDMVGIYTRHHPGHVVKDETGEIFYISDESLFGKEEDAVREFKHRRRIWGHFVTPGT